MPRNSSHIFVLQSPPSLNLTFCCSKSIFWRPSVYMLLRQFFSVDQRQREGLHFSEAFVNQFTREVEMEGLNVHLLEIHRRIGGLMGRSSPEKFVRVLLSPPEILGHSVPRTAQSRGRSKLTVPPLYRDTVLPRQPKGCMEHGGGRIVSKSWFRFEVDLMDVLW